MTAKQLTDSILQMAIQGKLVPQDPNDEPASVLLERIKEEKRRLVTEGKLKKKALEETPIDEDEIPYDIPQGWLWCRISDLFLHASGKQQSANNKQIGTLRKYITTSNLYWNRFVLDNLKEMYFSDDEVKSCSAQKGDLLVCEGGAGYGRSAIWSFDYEICLQNHVHRLRPYVEGICDYVYYLIYFLKDTNQLASVGMAMPGLSANRLKGLLVPLPPLAEQYRIVERIEEYLPVIKEYGEAYDEASKMDAELPDKLKKSILQEAIMGKLGTQDPSDAPASSLLNDIRAEKQKLVQEGLLKKKDLVETPVEDDEIPFNIPKTWEWGRLGDFFTIGSGLSYKKEDLQITSDNKVRVLRGGNISFGDWCQKPDDIFIAKKFVADELLLKEWTFITPAVSSLEHMGKTALIRESYDNIVVGGFILMLFPVYKSRPFLEYLNFLFQSYYYRQLCQSLTNKSGQAFYNLSRTKLLNAVIPIPPVDEQIRIVKKVEELFGEIDNMTVENNININEIEVTDNE